MGVSGIESICVPARALALFLALVAPLAAGCAPASSDVTQAVLALEDGPLEVTETMTRWAFDSNVRLGSSIAVDGDTAVVSVPGGDAVDLPYSGVVSVLYRDTGGAGAWGLVATLVGTDTGRGDRFGSSVAVDGDLIVVGAQYHDTVADDEGAAYVFRRNQGGTDAWGQVAKLVAPDPEADDLFGRSVAVAGDRIAVGAPTYDRRALGGPGRSGTVYVYGRDMGGGGAWGPVTQIQASAARPGDQFGYALSMESGRLAVGAQARVAASLAGGVYLFERDEGGADHWGEVRAVLPEDPTHWTFFGSALSLDGDELAVGAPGDDGAGGRRGAVYLFARDRGGDGLWGQVRKIAATDATDLAYFGDSVALDGDVLLVGADGDRNTDFSPDKAYVFGRDVDGVGAWGEVTQLAASSAHPGDFFGAAVAVAGRTAFVGAPGRDDVGDDSGALVVFSEDAGGAGAWGQTAQVLPVTAATPTISAGELGHAVAVHGDIAAVGAWQDNLGATDGGSVALFERDRGGVDNWGPVIKIGPSVRSRDQWFGESLALVGDLLVVGAPAGNTAGSAYLFGRSVGGTDRWGEITRLVSYDAMGVRCGESVATQGDLVLVGCTGPFPTSGSHSGAVYMYERNEGGVGLWGGVHKLEPSDPAGGQWFGSAIAIDGDTVVVGAQGDDGRRGAVYVFGRDVGGPDSWGEVTKITAFDADVAESFGATLGLSDDTLVVGAQDSVLRAGESMDAYVYGRDVGGTDTWGLVKKLDGMDTLPSDQAGWSVHIDGHVIVVGAKRDATVASGAGAAYLFSRNEGGPDNWGQVEKLLPTMAAGEFGWAAAVDDDVVVIGVRRAPRFDRSQVGAATFYTLTVDACLAEPCLNGGVCSNARAGYSCACPGAWSGTDCEIDVDECEEDTHDCDGNAACANTDGAFECTCNAGFEGDGRTCLATAPEDGGVTDGGAADGGPVAPPSSDGCGCGVVGISVNGAFWLPLAVALAVLVRRRRRGRRRPGGLRGGSEAQA